MKPTNRNAFLIALALPLMFLSACESGAVNTNLEVSPQFLDGLIEEVETVDECCPYTMEVIKDWIAQNEPPIE